MIIPYLPQEIISDILCRLPFEYAVPCMEVCKTWRNLLRHIKRHSIKRDKKMNLLFMGESRCGRHQLYHGEYDEKSNKTIREQLSYKALTPLGSPGIDYTNHLMACSHRGLVCFYEIHVGFNNNARYPIYICNPFTQETVCLPKLALPKYAENDFMVIGFGYLYATNEYKIVRIYYECGAYDRVHVYTLGGNNGWRDKGRTNYQLSRSHGVLYNGALYWIADSRLEFVAFDLADEKFWSVPIPPCFPVQFTHPYAELLLLMLGGYLSIVLGFGSSTDIWLLKDEKSGYSVEGHWSNEVTIHPEDDFPPAYYPFALTEENKFMVWRKVPSARNTLYRYDPNTATSENIWDDAFTETNFQAIPYMKCDVSLTRLVPELPVVDWCTRTDSIYIE